jgi:hypothetical protein
MTNDEQSMMNDEDETMNRYNNKEAESRICLQLYIKQQ